MLQTDFETMTRLAQLGLPQLKQGPGDDAVFDPFEHEGVEFYRYYDASICCWGIGRTVDPLERKYLPVPVQGESADCPDDVQALNALAFMPPPRLPEDFEGPLFRGPFWHRDQQFVWLLAAMNAGWELAICRTETACGEERGASFADGLTAY